jgi:hypothetical protein
MFKPIPTKYFVVHIDVAANDGSAVRISFSNLFKEFKSTSTWLQFPFVSNPSPTSVEAKTSSDILISSMCRSIVQIIYYNSFNLLGRGSIPGWTNTQGLKITE